MAAMEESSSSSLFMIDEAYEFSAPRFYDFIYGETEEAVRQAELWFEKAGPYAPSPFMPRIKASRSVQLDTLCDFGEEEQIQKAPESSDSETTSITEKETTTEPENPSKCAEELIPVENKEEASPDHNMKSDDKKTLDGGDGCSQDKESSLEGQASSSPAKPLREVCTPIPPQQTEPKRIKTAKKIASILKNPSVLKSKNQLQQLHTKSVKPTSVRRETNVKSIVATPNFAQENQAIKRQKLDGGKSRQILSIKPPHLPHKGRPGLNSSSFNLCTSMAKSKEDRKIYVREPAAPFVSMAEMMRKFQSSTRDVSLPSVRSSISQTDAAGTMQRKPKLTLTRPKEPEFETAHRVRPVTIKSSAELEEEMMAKIPKFKARPLNKKILGAPTLPSVPRSIPQPPEFKEFHLETMSRANQNAETPTVALTESAQNLAQLQNNEWKFHLTTPKSPVLQTSLRARPPKIKPSEELEKEELEKIPKFKARPLNRKIFESKGDMGVFCNMKKQVTMPQEFHFSINERIPLPPANVADIFDKLSIHSEPHNDKPFHRNTAPNPFHLHTEERGAEKEKKMAMELMQKQLEEERARIPRAQPYPYTTDYPVVPPKPEPKPCTEPEPFQLESLVRHEEEIQREMEERRRMETEEAQMRIFKAQPILKDSSNLFYEDDCRDPIPLPEKVRKPLTEVQEFNLHVNHRAIERAEFDQKIKEKEMMYKRYREEAESARVMEEEKALKQLRRTLVPHARPVPNFNHPFLPQKSCKEVTKAKSPKLHINRRKEKRRIVFAAAPVSSAASNMR